MSRSKPRRSVFIAGMALIVVGLLFVRCTADPMDSVVAAGPGSHADLVQLFEEWRAFEMPEFVDGVPDYSAAAMARQHAELPQWQRRLNALAPENWPVAEQIDWHLVPRGNERARLRPSDPPPLGARPGLLRDHVPGGERRPGP